MGLALSLLGHEFCVFACLSGPRELFNRLAQMQTDSDLCHMRQSAAAAAQNLLNKHVIFRRQGLHFYPNCLRSKS